MLSAVYLTIAMKTSLYLSLLSTTDSFIRYWELCDGHIFQNIANLNGEQVISTNKSIHSQFTTFSGFSAKHLGLYYERFQKLAMWMVIGLCCPIYEERLRRLNLKTSRNADCVVDWIHESRADLSSSTFHFVKGSIGSQRDWSTDATASRWEWSPAAIVWQLQSRSSVPK